MCNSVRLLVKNLARVRSVGGTIAAFRTFERCCTQPHAHQQPHARCLSISFTFTAVIRAGSEQSTYDHQPHIHNHILLSRTTFPYSLSRMPGLPVPNDMSALAAAWPASRIIKDPIGLVDDLFALQTPTTHTTDWHLPNFLHHQLHLPTALPYPAATHPSCQLHRVPQLRLAGPAAAARTPSHQSLVRLRGLVQNTRGSDYYLAAYRAGRGGGWRTARYRDCVGVEGGEVGVEEGSVVTAERMDVTVVELAGENEWVQQALADKSGDVQQAERGSESQLRSVRKRQLELECDEAAMEQDASTAPQAIGMDAPAGVTTDSTKRSKAASDADSAVANASPSAASCIVTLYGDHCHTLRVGDVVEVVGIYSITPHLLQDEDELGQNAIHSTHHIHCLTLLRCSPPFIHIPPKQLLLDARSSLLSHLTATCGGDSLAASLLLLCFVSRVQKRSPEGVMGKLTVELTRSSSTFAGRLTALCAKLLTHSVTLPITTATLSSTLLFPAKNYDDDSLSHSPLLLPPASTLVLDATALDGGELGGVGVRNVAVLNRLLEEQVLMHDFAFHEVLVPLDVSAVVLSPSRGLLFAHVSVPMAAAGADDGAGDTVAPVGEGEWNVWRQYMAAVKADAVQFHVGESVAAVVERLFVERRCSGGEAVTAEWLHRVLMVARLMVRSYGEEELSEARLTESVRLLDEVEQRNNAQVTADATPM